MDNQMKNILSLFLPFDSYSLIFLCRLALTLVQMALISLPSEILIEILLRRRIFAAAAAVAFAAMAAAVTLFDFSFAS